MSENTNKIVTQFTSKGAETTTAALTKMSHAATVLGTSFSEVVGDMGEFLMMGPQVVGVKDAFAELGGTAEQLDKVRAAVQGSIDDATLMKFQNVATLAEINADALDQFAVRALGASDALGLSVEEGFERLVNGVAKQEKELLDELGIKIRKLDVVYGEFAASAGKAVGDLTEEEKKLAFMNEALAKSSKLAEIGSRAQANEYEQMKAQMANMRAEASATIAEWARSAGVFDALKAGMSWVSGWFSDHKGDIEAVGAAVGSVLTAAWEHLMFVVETVSPFVEAVVGWIGEMVEKFGPRLKAIWEDAYDLGVRAWKYIAELVEENSGLFEALGDILETVFDVFVSILEVVVDVVEKVGEFIEWAKPAWEPVLGFITDAVKFTATFVENLADALGLIEKIDEAEKWRRRWADDPKWKAALEAERQHNLDMLEIAQMHTAERVKQAQLMMTDAQKTGFAGSEDAYQAGLDAWNTPEMAAVLEAGSFEANNAANEKKKSGVKKKAKQELKLWAKWIGELDLSQEGGAWGAAMFSAGIGRLLDDGESYAREKAEQLADWRQEQYQRKMEESVRMAQMYAELEASHVRNAEAIEKQAFEAKKARWAAGLQLANAGVGLLDGFIENERLKAVIGAAMEVAHAARDFAFGNVVGGALHLVAATKYGIAAAMAGGSAQAVPSASSLQKQTATSARRSDRDSFRSGARSGPARQAVSQTNIYQYQFGNGSTGRALIDAVNEEVRSGSGASFDGRATTGGRFMSKRSGL